MLKRNLKKAVLMTAIASAIGASSVANASIIDQPVFKILGAVVVWGGNAAGDAFEVNDFMVKSGTTTLDLIAANVQPVITGQLTSFPSGTGSADLLLEGTSIDTDNNGVLDLDDSLAAFSPSSSLTGLSSQQTSSFYVASNTAFTIQATATAADSTHLSKISRAMSVESSGAASGNLDFGSKSQLPNPSTNPFSGQGALTNLSTSPLVYTATRKTATAAGSIAEQSVRFTNTYELAGNTGLSAETGDITATITYTIAMP